MKKKIFSLDCTETAKLGMQGSQVHPQIFFHGISTKNVPSKVLIVRAILEFFSDHPTHKSKLLTISFLIPYDEIEIFSVTKRSDKNFKMELS